MLLFPFSHGKKLDVALKWYHVAVHEDPQLSTHFMFWKLYYMTEKMMQAVQEEGYVIEM